MTTRLLLLFSLTLNQKSRHFWNLSFLLNCENKSNPHQEPVLENPSVTLLTTNSPVPTVSLQSPQSYSNPRNEPQSPQGYNSSYLSRVIPQPEYSGYPSVAVQGVPDKGPEGFSGYPSYITLGRPDITLGDSKLNQIF